MWHHAAKAQTPAEMAGKGQLMKEAKKQWKRFNAEGQKIINDMITVDTEKVEWPENMEPKFIRKRGTKVTKVSYDKKTKRYMYYDNKSVTGGEPIRLDIPDAFPYFSYHPVKKEYIKIDAPSRDEPDTKYVVTAPYYHCIWERHITVLALLAYTTQNAQVTWNIIKSAIKRHLLKRHYTRELQNRNVTLS